MEKPSRYAITATLYERDGTAVYRAVGTADHVPVILKVLDPRRCRPKALDRQRSEYEIGRALALPAIARPLALETYEGKPALVIEDFGGQPLDRLLADLPLSVDRCLAVAVRIAGALADVHRQGIVHKDLKPQNILVNPATGEVRLTDFGLASRLPRETQAARPPQLIEGSLPYLSPEQTGRMNRAVDSRSDLYSLGVTLYQMLTGRLPFEARDPVEWVHCHVARAPASLTQLAPEVPEAVARIVTKLLAKMADDRYQTARGLKHDLERCLEQWRARRWIDPFPLGERDIPDRLPIPQKLYGRETEIAALMAAFERVADTGAPEVVLVSGYSGIGKSSLVHELEKSIVRRRGRFVAGKFDRYERDVPCSTIISGLRELVLGILAEAEGRIAAWKERLVAALGTNARLIVDVIPEVELVIGRQPPVAELPPVQAENRFRDVFRHFIALFADEEHPLTFSLDDLQWADWASLALVQDLVTHPGMRFLLVVGTYRDNEVTPAHPLMLMVDAARKGGARISDVVLGPLSRECLAAFLGDALGRRPDEVAALAALVREKTASNPFFAIQFLTLLHDEHLLELDEATGKWRWDLARIRTRAITDNVVHLMVEKLERLLPDTREALKTIACLGNSVDAAMASTALGRSNAETDAALWEALRDGLLFRADGSYRFLHDRVREAAYSLVPEASRPAAHLRIGRRLLSRLPAKEAQERVFQIVSQLNRGIDLITDPRERDSLCRLDWVAGRKAKASIAYPSALSYLETAAALLPADAWAARYEDAFALHLERAECEYLAGDFHRAEAHLDVLLGNARSDLDRARVHLLRMVLYQGSGRFDDALRTGLHALRLFGIRVPDEEKEIAAAFEADVREIRALVHGRRASDLVDAPESGVPDVRVILRLLVETWVPAYNARPDVHRLLIATAVKLSLVHGNEPDSGLAYGAYAMLLASSGELRSAFGFYEEALRLSEKLDDARSRASSISLHGVLGHWWKPVGTTVALMDRALRAQQEVGDVARAGITAVISAWTVVCEQGTPLDEALSASEKYLAFAEESRNDTVRETLRLIRQLVPAMKGTTREPGSLDDASFSEAAYLAAMAKASYGAGIALHHILKQVVAFIHGRYDEAIDAASQVAAAPRPVSAFLYDATHHFFHALTAAALYSEASGARQRELGRLLHDEQRRHALWTESCPENFQNRYALLSAELARVEGRELDAERLYEQAIRSARESGFVQNEAVACELASRFYRARGFDLVADAYLREARSSYGRWGAEGKVKQIDADHPRLLEPRPVAPTATFAANAEQVDLLAVAKGSQAISSEIVLDELLRMLLRVVLEQGGARRGCLLLARDGALSLEAEATIDESGARSTVLQSIPLGDSSRLVPASIAKYVQRTKERVILDGAAGAGKFSQDDYIARTKPRSALCLPIVRQAEVIGVLYLENDLVAGVFTPERLVALELLATQAAISVENASLLAKAQAARAAAEEAKSRFAFLAEAGALLSESLDYEETLARLARLCVQSMADWCVIDVVDGREIRRVGGAHADPAKEPLLRELQRRHPPRWGSPHAAARVLHSRQPLLFPELDDVEIRSLTEDDAHARLVRELGTRTGLAVPLVARDETLGVISLFSAAPGRRYGRADLDLAQELARRAAIAIDNARFYREAQDAIRLRDEFLSVASHELYTPMTSLMLSLEAMLAARRNGRSLAPGAMEKLLDLVSRQGRRLIRLIGDLLDVSRIETGRLVLDLADVDLGALVREVVERLEADLARSRCAVSIDAAAPVTGRWDRARLDQVVTNLLSNAVKFGPGAPIEVSIGAERGIARLVVRDRGIGISPPRQTRIFERFERAASAEHYGGLGLGLYISRRIVQAHSGSIRVESQPGAGSTFTVELPCAGPSDGAGQGRWREE